MLLLSKKDIFEIVNSKTNSRDYESEHTAEELIEGYPDDIFLLNKVKMKQ